jgi:dUTPase
MRSRGLVPCKLVQPRSESAGDPAIIHTRTHTHTLCVCVCACLYLIIFSMILVYERYRGSALVSTGIALAIPSGCYGRIAPRSGLAVKSSIDVGAGVIDPDYRVRACRVRVTVSV